MSIYFVKYAEGKIDLTSAHAFGRRKIFAPKKFTIILACVVAYCPMSEPYPNICANFEAASQKRKRIRSMLLFVCSGLVCLVPIDLPSYAFSFAWFFHSSFQGGCDIKLHDLWRFQIKTFHLTINKLLCAFQASSPALYHIPSAV